MLASSHVEWLATQGRFTGTADRGTLELPAGDAAWVSTVRTEPPGEAPSRELIDTYILIYDERVYFFEFISSEATADRYDGQFGCMIASLRWLPDAQSPEPGASISVP